MPYTFEFPKRTSTAKQKNLVEGFTWAMKKHAPELINAFFETKDRYTIKVVKDQQQTVFDMENKTISIPYDTLLGSGMDMVVSNLSKKLGL